jgi:hypothetical protein
MIVRVVRWAIENVIEVQEFEVAPDVQLIVLETMTDIRVRTLPAYEPPPKVEESH